jgi:hypothetical protein
MENWIYKYSPDNSSRFILGEIGEKNLICIGINPSTATPEALDNTLKKVKNFAHSNGYDGWIMLNVYPQRATNPKHIHNEMELTIHEENLKHLQFLVQEHPNFDVWASWGILINKRPFLKTCLKDVANVLGLNRNWLHLNELTKKQHPKHPLYLPYNSEFKKFDIDNYIQR